jgi:hypothetical protein
MGGEMPARPEVGGLQVLLAATVVQVPVVLRATPRAPLIHDGFAQILRSWKMSVPPLGGAAVYLFSQRSQLSTRHASCKPGAF